MNFKYNIVINFFIVIICIFSFFQDTFSMFLLNHCKHPPCESPNDFEIIQMRNRLNTMPAKKVLKKYSLISSIYYKKDNERLGKCGNWAFQTIIQADSLNISTTDDWIYFFKTNHHYFKQTKKPKSNGLAIYSSGIDSQIKHFGIITHTNHIKSKWGGCDYIFEHYPFHVPHVYGNFLYFFTLTKKYRKNSKILLRNIKRDINNSYHISQRFLYHHQVLLALANGKYKELLNREKNLDHNYQICTHIQNYLKTKDIYLIINELLTSAPWININTRIKKTGETLLMLAAQRGDFKMVKLFVQYNAHINAVDNNNLTAAIKAYNNGYLDIASYLTLL